MLVVLGAVAAGALTTLAPCVLPVLPVVVGGSLAPPPAEPEVRRDTAVLTAAPATTVLSPLARAVTITVSLGVSVIVFTLALKVTTALIDVPRLVWQLTSGLLLIGLGLTSLTPRLWERAAWRLQSRAATGLVAARGRGGRTGAVLTGAALGPVFSSCSPLYAYLVVTAFPASFGRATVLLAAYVVGLCATLLAIALLGQRAVRRARWAADPHGAFRRGLGVVFVLVGLVVLTGTDRTVQTWILEHSPVAPWNVDRHFIPGDA